MDALLACLLGIGSLMKDEDSVAEQMNRGLFLAPNLIDGNSDSPLLEQAKRNVEATAERAAAGEADEVKNPGIKKRRLFGTGSRGREKT
ncbi:MAG TPA: hypothetical protein VGG22_04625 [Candidatus Baltobacteraceae bacterium]|jgi:hypothetical protein